MSKQRFIHLHIHSDYSMIDGLAKPALLVKKAISLGMSSIAITDHMNLSSLIKFYQTSYSIGIKPIIGADFIMRSKILEQELTTFTLLAMNYIGYQNLIHLISKAYKRGYGKEGPTIDQDWLQNYGENLILLSGGRNGDLGKVLIRKNNRLINQCIEFYNKYFKDRYYIELIRTGRSNEEIYLNEALYLAEKNNIPVVATNDIRFLDEKDFEAHEVRVAIHDGLTLNDSKNRKKYSSKQYMKTEAEMYSLFSDIPESLENSVEISIRCNVTLNLGKKYSLPKFNTGKTSNEDFLNQKAKDGLDKRLNILYPKNNIRNKYRTIYEKRLQNELQVINKMGFSSYFLIVMEFIQWSKENKIPVGPGRGSGSGSLVAYSLGITDLDPIKFNLIFERFLNPKRVSMPDLDIDFCMQKRDIVIEHVTNIYGRDSVSQIITFGTMTAKAVIRDVGRVFGYQYKFVDHIAKLIPLDFGITLSKALKSEYRLKRLYNKNQDVKLLINMASKLEGVIRNVGKHAGGVVISPNKITDFSPLYCDEDGNNTVTQFDKTDIDIVGLVKFDFLGLKTLTIIDNTMNIINKNRYNQGLQKLNISSIPLNEKKIFDVLKTAETNAIFQLESRGMKELIKRLKPDSFEDIIALIALFRPGPLQSGMVDNFINRKHGLEKISYPDIKWQHESLKPVLKSTYGIILYQEQVMQIAQVIANYTPENADILLRAIGKKKKEEMEKQRSIFEDGAKRNSISSELAMKIFDLIEKFAGYGFNKSHSTAYALLSYQTLWLKTNYTTEFMSEVMNADIDNANKIISLIDECLRIGIKIIPPNINKGFYDFYVNEKNEIIYGMGAIKGIGKNSIETIVQSRNKYGKYKNIFDLCLRTKLNRRILEKLIISGALNSFSSSHSYLISMIDDSIKLAEQQINNKESYQIDMF